MCREDNTKYFFIRERRESPIGVGFHRVGVVGVRKLRKNGHRYSVSVSLCGRGDVFVAKKGIAKLYGRLDQGKRVIEFDSKTDIIPNNLESIFETLNLPIGKYNFQVFNIAIDPRNYNISM